jgi:hypothetical protein
LSAKAWRKAGVPPYVPLINIMSESRYALADKKIYFEGDYGGG